MAWNPETDGTFGEYMRAKNLQVRPNGWTCATHDQVTEGVGKDGRRFKKVRDQLGNDVIEHGQLQQSVRINSVETVHATIPASSIPGSTDVQR